MFDGMFEIKIIRPGQSLFDLAIKKSMFTNFFSYLAVYKVRNKIAAA